MRLRGRIQEGRIPVAPGGDPLGSFPGMQTACRSSQKLNSSGVGQSHSEAPGPPVLLVYVYRSRPKLFPQTLGQHKWAPHV